MSPRRVLVTGGAGFVGSHIVRALLRDGHDVIVYDAFIQYASPNANHDQPNFALRLGDVQHLIQIVRGSTLDQDDLRRVIVMERPDVIIHMAAMPLAALALERSQEAFHSILTGTRNILEILRDFERPCRLAFASSSMVYGDFITEKVTEDHPTNPRDLYGAFKLCGEIMVRAYARNYGLDTVIFRPSAVYGPFDANERVIHRFILSALSNRPITMHGDGSMKMDFTYVEDCADGIVCCAMHPDARGETFNVTRGQARSLKDLASILQGHFPNLEIEHGEKPDHVPLRGTLDIDRLRKMTNYAPKFDLESGINRYIDHLKSNVY